jgi:hypothetical protein
MRTAFTAAAAFAAFAALAPSPASSQAGGAGSNERINRLVIYGRDRCPSGAGEEIVVCARRPESERYRIPEQLREGSSNPENESWAVRAESLEYVGRTGTQSCSTVGPGGFTGCWDQMVRAWRAERAQNRAQ